MLVLIFLFTLYYIHHQCIHLFVPFAGCFPERTFFSGGKCASKVSRTRFRLNIVKHQDAYLYTIHVLFKVPGSTHYSMVFYFVTKKIAPGSLLQRFVDGDDEFRNSRLKLIPSVPKVSFFLPTTFLISVLIAYSYNCTMVNLILFLW